MTLCTTFFLQLGASVSFLAKQRIDFDGLQDPSWKKQFYVQCGLLRSGSFVALCFHSLEHVKSHFPSPHKYLYKIPVKIKLDWPPRTSQLIEMTLSPLCLTVWTIISTFHSDSLEKSKSRAKVYIFYVNNDLPTVWFLSRSCLLFDGLVASLSGLSVRLPHILVIASSLVFISKHCLVSQRCFSD